MSLIEVKTHSDAVFTLVDVFYADFFGSTAFETTVLYANKSIFNSRLHGRLPVCDYFEGLYYFKSRKIREIAY